MLWGRAGHLALKGVGTLILAIWVFMVKGEIAAASEEAAASITFTMKWTDGAKKMLDKVPTAFRQPAVDGTEQYAKDHNNDRGNGRSDDRFQERTGDVTKKKKRAGYDTYCRL